MKIFTHNFDPKSNSGPNKFTRQMLLNLLNRGLIETVADQEESDLEFVLISQGLLKKKPTVLRLDGIYFNSDQDFPNQNRPILYAYQKADHVIFQSQFNKNLTERWWGKKPNSSVIHNGPDVDLISKVKTDIWDDILGKDTDLWSCASSWRPHKRLSENLRYFVENSNSKSLMAVAGKEADLNTIKEWNKKSGDRIRYVGDLDYYSLISLYKRSSHFVHLAFLDHCPNVVVDAQAAGCKVVCASSGGTREIVSDGIVIKDIDWDFKPIKLYDPPVLDFSNSKDVKKEKMPNIKSVSDSYYEVFQKVAER